MAARPHIKLYTADLPRLEAFQARPGFARRLAWPAEGPALHAEMELRGVSFGIASVEAARRDHGLAPQGGGRRIRIVLRSEDTDAEIARPAAAGATVLSPPHDWLEGRLRPGWVADPDGNRVQIAQDRG